MRTLILSFILFGAAFQEPEPYPGQREHRKPPEGWFCSHDSPNPAKVCACKRMDTSHECDEPSTVIEDRTCKVYCHKQHCHCRILCEHPDHAPGEGPEDQPVEVPEGEE